MYKIIFFICAVSALLAVDSKPSQPSPSLDSKTNIESHTESSPPAQTQEPKAQNIDKANHQRAQEVQEQKTNQKENKEVYVDEGVVFALQKGDAHFAMYGDSYALVPDSKALKLFLNQQNSSRHTRTLRSDKSTTQIYNQGKEILFYYSSIKGSNLYSKIAPKTFKLTLEEYNDESKEPYEMIHIYRIHDFDEAILHSPCLIVQSRHFIRDRARSEILINLNAKINPKLLSQGQIELFLQCQIQNDYFG